MSIFSRQEVTSVMMLANENQGQRSPEWYAQILDDLEARSHGIDEIYGAVNQFRLFGGFGGVSTAELIKILEGDRPSRAIEAFVKAKNAIGSCGGHKSVCFDDAMIHVVINQMGGWLGFCQHDERAMQGRISDQFTSLYRSAIDRPPESHPRRLMGEDGGALAARSTGKVDEVKLVGNNDDEKRRALKVFTSGEGWRENIAELGADMRFLPTTWLVRFFDNESKLKLENDAKLEAIKAMTEDERRMLTDEEIAPVYLPKFRATVGKGLEEYVRVKAESEGIPVRSAVYLPHVEVARLAAPKLSATDQAMADMMEKQTKEGMTPLQARIRAIQGKSDIGKKLDMESSITPASVRRKEQAAKDIEDKRIFDEKFAGLMASQDSDQSSKRPQA